MRGSPTKRFCIQLNCTCPEQLKNYVRMSRDISVNWRYWSHFISSSPWMLLFLTTSYIDIVCPYKNFLPSFYFDAAIDCLLVRCQHWSMKAISFLDEYNALMHSPSFKTDYNITLWFQSSTLVKKQQPFWLNCFNRKHPVHQIFNLLHIVHKH